MSPLLSSILFLLLPLFSFAIQLNETDITTLFEVESRFTDEFSQYEDVVKVEQAPLAGLKIEEIDKETKLGNESSPEEFTQVNVTAFEAAVTTVQIETNYLLSHTLRASNPVSCNLRGVLQLVFVAPTPSNHLSLEFSVSFKQSNDAPITVQGFIDGTNRFIARAYCSKPGLWTWISTSNVPLLHNIRGSYSVTSSSILPGKLRLHSDDRRQFQRHDGTWFLHIGDTAYNFLKKDELNWKAYIDQAASIGITKIRTWIARSSVPTALFDTKLMQFKLDIFNIADTRILYVLNNYPNIEIQLNILSADLSAVASYNSRQIVALSAVNAMMARWSSIPNIHWCLTNDQRLDQRLNSWIASFGDNIKAKEKWGTLITNHQARTSGYNFATQSWSNIITIQNIDQVYGQNSYLMQRLTVNNIQPIVLDEDRIKVLRIRLTILEGLCGEI